MTLKYFIRLISDVGEKSQKEAKILEDAHKRMNSAVVDTAGKVLGLERALDKAGRNTSVERQIGYMQRLGHAVDATAAKAAKMRLAVANAIDKAPEKFAAATGAAAGANVVLAPPIRAFSSLEAATMDLKVAMTDAKGDVSADFGKISKEAEKLGSQLPGTTKDFMAAARALVAQGTPSSVVANGGLRASSYLGVLLRQNQEQSAETVAKLREAHGLKDEELVPMADLVQRGYFGFGIKPQDYLETAKYAASTYNTMGITGLGQARETLAIQGMAANVGLEGSSFGTNYSQMLRRLGEMEHRTTKNSAEAKEVRALLGGHGISMQFYTDKGVFKGNLNMLEQLAKLRALNPLEQQKVLTRLFGVEAGRPAQIMVQKGLEGYQASLNTIVNQADLDKRVGMSMETFAAKLDSLGGTIENVNAKIGSQLGAALKPVMDGANKALGGPLSGFIDKNPGVATAGLLGTAGASAYLLGRVGGELWKAVLRVGGAQTAAAVATEASTTAAAGAAAGAAAKAVAPMTGLAVANKALKAGGITAAIAGLLETIAVMADEKEQDKTRAVSRIGVTSAAGVLAGAGTGAAMGSIMPGIGTLAGASVGLLGGLMGMWGGGALFDAMWSHGGRGAGFDDPRRLDGLAQGRQYAPRLDYLNLSIPGEPTTAIALQKSTDIRVGEGRLQVDVRVSSDGFVTIRPEVTQQPSLIKINMGNTNPQGLR